MSFTLGLSHGPVCATDGYACPCKSARLRESIWYAASTGDAAMTALRLAERPDLAHLPVLTHSLTHTHTCSPHTLTHMFICSYDHMLTHSHTLTHTLSHSLTHTLTYSHTHTHSHDHMITCSHTHTPLTTHTLTHSLTLVFFH